MDFFSELVLIIYFATKEARRHFDKFRFRFVTFCLNQRVFQRREECSIRCGPILEQDMRSCVIIIESTWRFDESLCLIRVVAVYIRNSLHSGDEDGGWCLF